MKDQPEINKQVISTLNTLIEVCKDGEQGFKEAAHAVSDPELKTLCLQYSGERSLFARELQYEVRQLQTTPENTGSIAGALHRGWLNLKAALTAQDEDAIIAECERGEDVAKAAYEKALSDYLPPALTGVVQRQYQKVRAAHDRFSALQKAAK